MRVEIVNLLPGSRTKVRLKCPSLFAACKMFGPLREEPVALRRLLRDTNTAFIALRSVGM